MKSSITCCGKCLKIIGCIDLHGNNHKDSDVGNCRAYWPVDKKERDLLIQERNSALELSALAWQAIITHEAVSKVNREHLGVFSKETVRAIKNGDIVTSMHYASCDAKAINSSLVDASFDFAGKDGWCRPNDMSVFFR